MPWIPAFFNARANTTNAALMLVLSSLLLSGCATVSAPTEPATTATPQAAVLRAYHDAIDLAGRLSVRYQENGKDQAVHGSFTWTQNTGHTVVTLLSPLGQTLATIDIKPTSSTLIQAGQPPRMAADVDALAAEALGWPLPVSGLRDWLQGFTVDAAGRRPVVAQESANVTTRDGWRIQYASWEDSADPAQRRPKRIDLARNTAQAGDVTLRVVIDNWQPH